MGICYYHGGEVYPGHPCEECEIKERIDSVGSDEAWRKIKSYELSRGLSEVQGKDTLAIQQGKIDFRTHKRRKIK